ncbi:ABC transporter permease [candidate division KSB1 bacterium]|nr:ABC transporter permease [candidate division KSB1 bacterium]
MLKNYLKIAWRNLLRQKLYAFINIFGLAIGLAFCALIFLYVRDELTFDRFHEQRDQIYRVYKAYYNPDGSNDRNDVWLPMPLGPAMRADLPEVEQYVRFQQRQYFVKAGTEAVKDEIVFADASIFEVFTFPLLRGEPKTALADLNNVVLSEKMARKYFGDTDPTGQRLGIRLSDRFEDFIVTGIAKEAPGNSSIRFDILVPFSRVMLLDAGAADQWGWNSYFTFVQVKENTVMADLEEKLIAFRAKYFPNEVQKLRNEGRWSGDGIPVRYHLQPLTDIHLNTQIDGGLTPPSNPSYSYILGSIALGVLLIACINFMTLAIGRSASRAREIGLRKVVGAPRTQLMRQFWGEAILLSCLALAIGIGLAELLLPVFNDLAGKTLRFDYVSNADTLLALLFLVLGTGLVAGSYPALLLSRIQPVETLKNRLKLGGSNVVTRLLVVLQFTLSVFLIVSTFVMLRQLRYIQSKDLGFDKEQVVVIPLQGLDGQRVLRLFQNELGNRRDIAGVTGISNAFAWGTYRQGFKHKGEEKAVYIYGVESNFLDVLGMDLVAGRNFDPKRVTDSTHAVIINEAMARDFGWSDPVGQVVSGLFEDKPWRNPTVIGVVKDFNFRSLHNPVEPMFISLGMNNTIYFMLVRIRPGDMAGALAALRIAWEKVAPEVPFTYNFLDDDLDRQYQSEQRWGRIVGYASLFAIMVACLGLFGLAALTVAGRTKEIGIRKVLGASITSVTTLISKNFAWLVFIGIVLAVPAAYFTMSQWLEGFAYRIDIGWWVFVFAGGIALLIALLTVSAQAIKAALANPVEALRYE